MPVIAIVASTLGLLLFSLVPTATYLYVEKRSRRHWMETTIATNPPTRPMPARSGEARSRRKAPLLVRAVAWMSLALAQLALPILAVPATCGFVVATLSRIGKASLGTTSLLLLLGIAAVAQAVFALRLFPLGIRLLARDAKLQSGGAAFASSFAWVHTAALGASALAYLFLRGPGFLERVVRATVHYGAVLPVAGVAAASLVLSILIARAARALQ